MIKPREFGAKGKICIVGGSPAISDFHRWLHPDIDIASTPMPLKTLSPEGLLDMGKRLPECYDMLSIYEPSDLAFFSCTAGSLIGGQGYDEKLCDIIKKSAKTKEAYTTTTAVLGAFKALGSKQISIITPYPEDINETERAFFSDKGYIINNINGIKTEDPRNNKLIRKISQDAIYDFAINNMDPRSDTLFISCTGLMVLEIISELEKKLSVPVVTSNQAAIWQMGKFIGIHSEYANENLGKLFTV